MKKIILLATGGTIACVPGADGLAPGVTAAQLLARTPQLNRLAEMTGRDVFSLDSSNIQPEEWRVLARAARDALNESDGVVITHGTDTLAYSAAALSFMLREPKGPVVLTGSQLPLEHPLSDAPSNLVEAVETACTAPPGVYVVFNHKIIRGTRAVKLRTTSFDAFDSVNAPLAGTLDAEGAHYRPFDPPAGAPMRLEDELETRVFLLKLMPGTSPEVFDWIARVGHARAGAGGLRHGRPALHPAQSGGQAQNAVPARRSHAGDHPVPLRARQFLRLRGGPRRAVRKGVQRPGHDQRGRGGQADVGAGQARGAPLPAE